MLTDGTDTAAVVYNAGEALLDLYINNGFTSLLTVVEAINGEAALPFEAALAGNCDGTEILHTAAGHHGHQRRGEF